MPAIQEQWGLSEIFFNFYMLQIVKSCNRFVDPHFIIRVQKCVVYLGVRIMRNVCLVQHH
jgi:hypothetical protein